MALVFLAQFFPASHPVNRNHPSQSSLSLKLCQGSRQASGRYANLSVMRQSPSRAPEIDHAKFI